MSKIKVIKQKDVPPLTENPELGELKLKTKKLPTVEETVKRWIKEHKENKEAEREQSLAFLAGVGL